MPQIIADSNLKNEFINKLQERSAPIREEIHVSDLVYCLRKAYYRRFENRKLSEQQLIFFLDGHQRHEGLQSLVGNLEKEKEVRKFGVVGHIDICGKYPIEIKTTRSRPNSQRPEQYLRQLAYYCLLTETDTGNLITQYINDGFLTFEKITFSQDELDVYLREMLSSRDLLELSYKTVSVNPLPVLGNWQCTHCEFKAKCLL